MMVANGSIRAQAHNFAWGATLADLYVAEQPHSALEFVYGPPAFVTNTAWHGSRSSKWWLLWTPNRPLPEVLPTEVVPTEQLLARPLTLALVWARNPFGHRAVQSPSVMQGL